MSADFSTLSVRDTSSMLRETIDTWGGETDLWVFGYAALIWRPEFEAAEQRPAAVHGWHRALERRSRINRGMSRPRPERTRGRGIPACRG